MSDYVAFWVFALLFFISLLLTVASGRILSLKKPNPTKISTYECGQPPVGRAYDFRIGGVSRYFAYAVIFYALDAFGWIIATASFAHLLDFRIVVAYVLIVALGFAYFLSSLKELVR